MITLGQQRLQELVYGHPLAVARLRAMERVIRAAIAIHNRFEQGDGDFEYDLENALREGGWL